MWRTGGNFHRCDTFRLDSLLIRTGPLADLNAQVTIWEKVADELRGIYPGADWGNNVAELCTVYYKHGKKSFPHTKPYGKSAEDQLPTVTGFLEDFMERNGQWPYINGQSW